MLGIAPCFDEATQYSFRWFERLKEALNVPFNELLLKEEATRENFEKKAEFHRLICFYDHGNEDRLISQDNKDPILDLNNVDLVSGKEVYTMACLSAKVLGKEAWKKGCMAYIGYYETFIFTTTDEGLFCEAANYGMILRVNEGLSWEETYDKMMGKFDEMISRAMDPFAKVMLRYDRDALRVYTLDRPPEPEECPVSEFMARVFGYKTLNRLRRIRDKIWA